MKCAFLGTKIAASFETAKRNLLKSVKGFEKVRSTSIRLKHRIPFHPILRGLDLVFPCLYILKHEIKPLKFNIMDTRVRHIPTGNEYANRKEAKQKMGHGRYNRALRDGEMLFASTSKPLNI